MRPTTTLPLLLLLLAACGSTPPGGVSVDPEDMGRPLELERRERAEQAPSEARRPDEGSTSRVLAYVDGEVITYRDILLRAGPQLAVLGEEDRRRVLEEQELLSIIRERVRYHAAVEQGVEMSRDELDKERAARVAELERNGGTLSAFLAERSMTRRELDDEIRRGWISDRYMLAALGLAGGDPRIRPVTDVFVTPGEIREYWERHQEMFREPEHARLRVLTVRTDRDADDREAAVAAARAIAERARQRLASGEDWVPVYRETMGDVAEDDADGLLLVARGKRAEWMEEFAFERPRGTVSDVVQVGTTFYVMRAEGASPERVVPFEECHELIRQKLGQARRGMAGYEVELKLLERASVQPERLAEQLRDLLRGARRKVMDQLDL